MYNRKRSPFLNRWYKNLLLSLVGVVVALLLLEFALRLYLRYYPDRAAGLFLEPPTASLGLELFASDGQTWITQGNPEDFKFVFHPYLTYKNLPDQQDPTYQVNSLGLRGEDVTINKSPDVFRVIVVGGSTAFGLAASTDASTWAAQLQQKLNVCPSFSQKVEVFNAGMIGYLTEQEIMYLQLELLELSPDLVIAFDGYNDFANPAYETDGCRAPLSVHFNIANSALFGQIAEQLQHHAKERERAISAQMGRLWRSVATSTYIGKFFYKRLQALERPTGQTLFSDRSGPVFAASAESRATVPALNAECVAKIIDHYQKNLQKMARLVNGRGIPLLIALQPEVSFKKERSPKENEAVEGETQGWPGYRPAVAYIYPQMATAAASVAEQNPLTTFLNLTDVFGHRSEDVFVDACHLNDHGHEIVAQFLANYLCERRQEARGKKQEARSKRPEAGN
jgi:hypothetical protein